MAPKIGFILVLLVTPAFAIAQDAPKVGLTMGYPSAVGVIWQAADRVALRGEFAWTVGSSESSSSDPILGAPTAASPADSSSVGAGVSALFYLSRHDALRTYVAPRFAYSRNSATATVAGGPVSSSSDGWLYSTSGSFGAQYTMARHFGVFGEIGLNYNSSTTRTSTVETITTGIGISSGIAGSVVTRTTSFTIRGDGHSRSFGTRGGVGVIFYF